MKKVTYIGVFEPSGEGYSVYFPDLPGCISYGESFEDARREAGDALGLHLYGMEKDGDDIPTPSAKVEVDPETAAGHFLSPVTIFPDIVKNELNNKAVRVSTTVPSWLKDIAEINKINYSDVLTTALKDALGIDDTPGKLSSDRTLGAQS